MIHRSTDFNILENTDEEKPKAYCKKCLALPGGKLSIMGERTYPNLTDKDPLPTDHDRWKQCPACGYTVAIQNIKYSGKLVPAVGYIPENPSDIAGSFVESINKGKSISTTRLEKRRMEEELNAIKDLDVKSIMRSGRKLLSYHDSLDR